MAIEFRLAKNSACCRMCDKGLRKGVDLMVTWYSFRNSGMRIILCVQCVNKLHDIVNGKV